MNREEITEKIRRRKEDLLLHTSGKCECTSKGRCLLNQKEARVEIRILLRRLENK